MKFTKKSVSCLLTAGLFSSLSLGAQAADWSDSWIQYRVGNKFHEPNNQLDVKKNVVQLGYASGYKYGSNFFTVDALHSDDADPAQGGDSGATEIYMVYRHQLHLGKILEKDLAFGPVKDIGLTAGFDLNTKDTAVAPRKRLLVAGPTLKFDVPGFLDVSLMAAKEQNHNAFGSQEKTRDFDTQALLNVSWGIPFTLGAVPLKFSGYLNYLSGKGKDYNGRETSPETTSRSYLMADVGQMTMGRKNLFLMGIGFEYWRNKFGNNDNTASRGNLTTRAPMLVTEFHF